MKNQDNYFDMYADFKKYLFYLYGSFFFTAIKLQHFLLKIKSFFHVVQICRKGMEWESPTLKFENLTVVQKYLECPRQSWDYLSNELSIRFYYLWFLKSNFCAKKFMIVFFRKIIRYIYLLCGYIYTTMIYKIPFQKAKAKNGITWWGGSCFF